MAFGMKKMIKLCMTTDEAERVRVQTLLHQQGIACKLKAKDCTQINIPDAFALGNMGKPQGKLTYTFYVNKEDADTALMLIRARD